MAENRMLTVFMSAKCSIYPKPIDKKKHPDDFKKHLGDLKKHQVD